MHYPKTLLTIAATILSVSAFAQSSSASGLYLALDGGLAAHDVIDDTAGKQTTGTITLGYDLAPALSVEVSARDLGKRQVVEAGLGVAWRSQVVTAAAVLRTELTRQVYLTGKLGAAFSRVDATLWASTDSAEGRIRETGALAGVGLEGRLDKHFSWRANYDVYPNFAQSRHAMKTYSLGVVYRF